MKARRGELLAVAGALCVLASAVLFGHNVADAARASRESAAALAAVNAAITERNAAPEQNAADGATVERESADGAPPASATPQAIADPDVGVTVDGERYLGYVSMPVLNLELAVYAEWDDARLQSAPCRYSGSISGGALVIGAHNYDRHFGGISKLAEGDVVLLTDGNGTTHRYTVAESEILPPDAVDEMKSDEWELTLFTCTYGGQNRVTVRCTAG